MKKILLLIVLSTSCSFAFADDCGGQFSNSGAFLLGKTFKLKVEIANAPAPAFNGAYRAVVKEGWKVEHADREIGVINAVHGESALKGKRMPLSVTIEPVANGSELTLLFSTPPGLGSAESDVRDGFCRIVAGAAKATLQSSDSTPTPVLPPAAEKSTKGAAAPAAVEPSARSGGGASTNSKSDLSLKWTSQVAETIEVLDVTTDRPATIRFVKLTYQALKSCSTLAVGGSSYSKDGINLGPVIFQALNVRPGQKFRAEFAATYEPNHYVVLEHAYCNR
jgi:hypothetical protein